MRQALAMPDAAWPAYRCPRCGTLLFRGYLVGEVVCHRCKKLICLDFHRKHPGILQDISEAFALAAGERD